MDDATLEPAPACTPGPSGGPPWQRTLYACWVAQFLSIIGFSFVMPFMPFFVRYLGVATEAQVAIWSGLLVTASGLMGALFAPIWGGLADRYGRKMMVERAMFGGAVLMSLMGFAASVHQLLILRLLQGALTGTIVASTTLVAAITPQHRMGFSLGLLQVSVLMGNTVGPWMGGVVADQWGYRVPFWVSGALLFLGGVVVLVAAYEDFCPPEPGKGTNHGLRQAFGRKGLLALMVSFFMVSMAASFMGPIYPLLVEEIAGSEGAARTAGMLLGIGGLASGISALGIGLLGDRIGHKSVLVVCTLGAGMFAAPHYFARTIGQLVVLRIGMGLSRGGTAPTQNAIIGQAVSADTYGRSFGNSRVAAALGMAVGPLLGGFAAAQFGLRWPFVIMSGLLALSALLVVRWVRVPKRSPEAGVSEALQGLPAK
ncbi:MAG: MFS transporter [Armatimonadota bacterium]